MIFVFALYTTLASTFTLGKMLLDYVPPLFLVGVRMIFSGTILLAGYYMFAKSKTKLQRQDFVALFGISLIHIFIPYAGEFIAMQTLEPATAALMFNLSPFFTAFFSYFYFSEKMTKTKLLGMLIGFSGLLYFIKPATLLSHSAKGTAYLLMLLAITTASLAWVIIRKYVQHHHFSPVLINGYAMFFAGFESLAASYLCGENVSFAHVDMYKFLLLFIAIVVCANIFYNFYGYLLKIYTATFLAFMGIVTPLITSVFDWWLLGISIHMDFIVTAMFIACGVTLFYKEELKQGYISK